MDKKSVAHKTKSRQFLSSPALLASIIAGITFFAYLPALKNDFVNWDDYLYVIDNKNLKSIDLRFLKFLITPDGFPPLTNFSFAVDYVLWGLNPSGYHLVNIILHTANTFLVFVLIGNILKFKVFKQYASDKNLVAGTVAFLFGIHTLNVEAAAWLMGRGNLLSPLFFLLTILAYLRYNSTRGKQQLMFYTLSILFFAMSLMSKPISATLPLVLLIIDFFLMERVATGKGLGKRLGMVLLEKVPFFLLSLLWFVISTRVRAAWLQTSTIEPMKMDFLFVAVRAATFYLQKILLPFSLAPFYPYPKNVALLNFEYIGSLILLAGVTFFCFSYHRKNRLYLALWLFYLSMLLPTLIPLLGLYRSLYAEADRYAYLPALGPFLLIGLGVGSLFRKKMFAGYRNVITAALISISALLAVNTFNQIRVWQNSITLWTHEIRAWPNSEVGYYNRGNAYITLGQTDKAIQDFSQAIELYPQHLDAYNNRGGAYLSLGNYTHAIEDFNVVIDIKPDDADLYNNRGNAYFGLNDFTRAIKDYDKALGLHPEYPLAYNNRGSAYSKIGNYQEAKKDFRRAIALDPQYTEAFNNLDIVNKQTEGLQ